MGSIERTLEGLIRYKFITLSAVLFFVILLVGLNAMSSSKVLTQLNNDQTLVNQDPSLFGLVKLNSINDLQTGSTSMDLQATAYLNLRDPVQAQTAWKAFASGTDLKPISLNVTSFSELNAPGAQVTSFSIPVSYNTLVFCMTALHPAYKKLYTAKWSFSVRTNNSTINISRNGQDSLTPESSEGCK
jgi:hypothetical protein